MEFSLQFRWIKPGNAVGIGNSDCHRIPEGIGDRKQPRVGLSLDIWEFFHGKGTQALPKEVWSCHPWRNSKDVELGIRWDLIIQEGFSKARNSRISGFNPGFFQGLGSAVSCSAPTAEAARKSWNFHGEKTSRSKISTSFYGKGVVIALFPLFHQDPIGAANSKSDP